MHAQDHFWRVLLLFYGALIGIIFGFMFLSFPFGAYLVFNTELGSTINYEFPLDSSQLFAGLPIQIPITMQLGELFILLWSFYLLFFSILMLGPQRNILQSLISTVNGEIQSSKENALLMVIVWLAVLVVVSKGLEFLQQSVGVSIGSFEMPNALLRFFSVTAAPVNEELAFRVLLIGVPGYFMFVERQSIKNFFKTLWYPSKYTMSTPYIRRNFFVLITISAILFGVAHIFFGGWSYGKVTQAMIGGWIIGWLYYRYGLHAAILMHWSTNYFVFSHVYFGNEVWSVPSGGTENPLIGGIDLLLTMTGIITIGLFFQKKITNYLSVREQNSFKDSNII